MSLCAWGAFLYFEETSPQSLITIKGNFDTISEAEVIDNFNGFSQLSTVISLENYPNQFFNLGQSIGYEKVLKELDLAQKPITITFHIQEKYYSENRTYIPAFYGFWINEKEIKSDKNGFESNKKANEMFLLVAFVLSAITLFSLIKF